MGGCVRDTPFGPSLSMQYSEKQVRCNRLQRDPGTVLVPAEVIHSSTPLSPRSGD